MDFKEEMEIVERYLREGSHAIGNEKDLQKKDRLIEIHRLLVDTRNSITTKNELKIKKLREYILKKGLYKNVHNEKELKYVVERSVKEIIGKEQDTSKTFEYSFYTTLLKIEQLKSMPILCEGHIINLFNLMNKYVFGLDEAYEILYDYKFIGRRGKIRDSNYLIPTPDEFKTCQARSTVLNRIAINRSVNGAQFSLWEVYRAIVKDKEERISVRTRAIAMGGQSKFQKIYSDRTRRMGGVTHCD